MSDLQLLVNNLRSLSQSIHEGLNQTPLPYLSILYTKRHTIELSRDELFFLYFVLAGSLRLNMPSGILDYVAGQCSISKIDTPTSGTVLTHSSDGDFIAAVLEVSLDEILSILIEFVDQAVHAIIDKTLAEEVMEESEKSALSVLIRLFAISNDPLKRSFMGKELKHEIVFHLLCGTSGNQLLQSATTIHQAGEIYKVNS